VKKLLAVVAAVFLIATPVYAYHTETQTPYDITNTLNNDGSITVSWQESDGFEDNPPEYYIVYIGLTETADDISEQTDFGFTEALSWQSYTFTAEYLYNNLSVDNQKIYAKVKAFHDTNGTTSDFTPVESVLYDYVYIPTTTTSSSTTTTTTTTTTTLPKAEDVVEDGITTYLAWDENGCEHPGNPLSYKQYLEAVESGDWYGYQPGDCTDIPDDVIIIIEEEEIDELDEEILRDDDLGEETVEEEFEDTDSEEEEIILLEEEIELTDEEVELTDEEVGLTVEEIEELEEFIEDLEELIIEEIIELDIPDDIIIIEIEEEEIEEEIIIDETEVLPETDEGTEEVLDESVQEDVEEEPVELTEEEIAVEVAEVQEVIETIIVEEATTEEVIEVLEEVNDVGVQNLEEVSEEVQEVVQEIVEEAIDNVEELTEEQVEVVAEVLQVETEDVEIIAEAVKSDEAVAEAVEEYVERAVENADVEDYTLADVVTEVQFENFIENPIETLVDIDLKEINLSNLSDDMTSDQKEKAQEVVVPVILTRIASMAAFIFRRS
tara:strand:+ start:8074 stop:9726 length:1653 start_codon:yes stop_codon:yes gene_type:complete